MGTLISKSNTENQHQHLNQNSLSSSSSSSEASKDSSSNSKVTTKNHNETNHKKHEENHYTFDDAKVGNLNNPGTVEEIHRECKDVIPDFNDGSRILVNNWLSSSFMVSHQLRLTPNPKNGYYRFGATYIGSTRSKMNPLESYPILFGEISLSDGSLQANIIHKIFNDKLRLRLGLEYTKLSLTGTTLLLDYYAKTSTISFGIANPNILNQFSGTIVFQYLQSITKKLSLGFEIARRYNNNVTFLTPPSQSLLSPIDYITMFNAILRYNRNNSIISTTLGLNGLHLSYFLECSSQLRFGIEFKTNFNDVVDTISTKFAYEITLPKYQNLIIRNSIDTNWNVCSTLEKKLTPLSLVFTLGALLNHRANKFRLCCGLVTG